MRDGTGVQKTKQRQRAWKMQVITTKIRCKTTLLFYSILCPSELSAKLVAEKPCCDGLAASEQ